MRYNAAPGASAYGKPILNVVDKPCKKKPVRPQSEDSYYKGDDG